VAYVYVWKKGGLDWQRDERRRAGAAVDTARADARELTHAG
jgi:hypothetical protein